MQRKELHVHVYKMHLLKFLLPMFALLSAVVKVCNAQVVTVTMQLTTSADQGSDATITCSYTVTDNTYTWLAVRWRKGAVDGTYDTATEVAFILNIGQPPQYPDGGASKYSMSNDSIATRTVLTVSSVHFTSDEGRYWCFAEFRKSGSTPPSDICSTQLTVTVLPTSITFSDATTTYPGTGDTAYVVAGQNHPFTCEVPGINPGASFQWTVGSQNVSLVGGTNDVIGTDGLTTSTSIATLEPVWSFHGDALTCQAFNKNGHGGLTATVSLDVRVPPSTVSLSDPNGNLNQGTAFTFTCTVPNTRPAATIKWYLHDVEQETATPPPPGSGDTLVDTSDDWTLTPARANHGQEVKCEGSTAESQGTLPNLIMTLDVNGPPDDPVITVSTTLIENESTDLTCQADLGYPNDWQLTWSNGTENITGPTTTPADSTDNRYRFTSMFTYIPKREDYNDTTCTCISCAAKRDGFSPTTAATYSIMNVQFCARTVRMDSCPENHVIAGGTRNFSCTSESSNPRTTLTWTGSSGADGDTSYQPGGYGGEESVKPYNTGVLSKVHNGGVYTCTATNTGITCTAEVTASCTLNVHYAPEFTGPPTVNPTNAVNEGGDVVLTCTVDANPKTNEIITWIKQDTGEDLTSSIYNDSTSTLTLIGVTREQAGSYMCRANNGVPTADDNVFSDLVVVSVLYEANITSKSNNEEGVKSGENANLTCIAKANPAPTMKWFDQNITAITNDTKPEKYTMVDTTLSGNDTYGFVVSSVLVIKNVTSEDYGVYTCNSTNVIGVQDTHRITLNVTRIPNKPTNVQITNQTVSSLTVSWTFGYDGGEEQHFIIAHLKSETDETELGRSDKVTETTYTVTGLEPITQYEIRVYAQNLVGTSTFGKAVAYTLPLPPDGNSEYDIKFDPQKSTVTISGLTEDNGCIQLEVMDVNDSAWSVCGKCIKTNSVVQLPGYCDQGRRRRRATETVEVVQARLCYPIARVCSPPFMVPEKDSGVTAKDQTGLIVGVTIGVVVLIIVIIVLLVYLRRTPGKNEKHDTSVELQTPSSMSTVESGRANGVNNEGMETNDEEAPKEVVVLDSKPADTGDTYAVLNTEPKSKKREPANLPDVTYGVVEKKAQRKTPKGVKKYKPSSAAADETAFDEGGYDDVQIGQLKKPEKKDDDDDTYANVGQQQDDRGRVVNEDGLIYAEVSHNKTHPADQPPIQTEESTLYASLDYKATKENKNSSEDGNQE